MIGLVATNYNNAHLTHAMIASIMSSDAAQEFAIVIVDNASNPADVALLKQANEKYPSVSIIYHDENVGYFSGLNIGIQALRDRDVPVDTIVVGNNDLEFPAGFYQALVRSGSRNFARYPVVAPDLVTPVGEHQNPHVADSISKLRVVVWHVYYSSYTAARVINRLAQLTRRFLGRRDHDLHPHAGPIQEGYGACYILTPLFFEYYEALWAPTFLMGEEFFLSKQISAIGKQIFYDPDVVVCHLDHGSVGQIPQRNLWEICRKSHRVYMEYYRRYA